MEFIIKADEIDIDDHPVTDVGSKVKEALRVSIKRHGTCWPLFEKEELMNKLSSNIIP